MVAREIEREERRDLSKAVSGDVSVRVALRDVAPVIIGLAPVGLALGTSIAESPVASTTGWASSPLLYGASAQLTAVAMLGAGTVALPIIGAVAAINARSVLYSAGLRPLFTGQPAWFRWLAAYLLVDPLYGLVLGARERLSSPGEVRRYYLTAGLAIWLTWLPLVAVGIVLGPALPVGTAYRFALPALLIAFLVPSARGWNARAAVVAAVTLMLVTGPMNGLGLLVAAAGGAGVSTLIQTWRS